MFVSGRVNWLKHIKSQDCHDLPPTNSSLTRPTLKTWWFRWNILNDWYNQHRKYAYIYIYFLGVPPDSFILLTWRKWVQKTWHLHIARCFFPTGKKTIRTIDTFSNLRCIKGPGILGKPTCWVWPIPKHPGFFFRMAGSPKNHPFFEKEHQLQKTSMTLGSM